MLKAKDRVLKSLRRRHFWVPVLLAVVVLMALIALFLLSAPRKALLDETVTLDPYDNEFHSIWRPDPTYGPILLSWVRGGCSFFYVADEEGEKIQVEISVISGPKISRLRVTRQKQKDYWEPIFNKENFSYFNEELTLPRRGQYAFDIDVGSQTTIRIRIWDLEKAD